MNKGGKITLPRSVLTEEMWRDKDLWQLYGYLLSKADKDGVVEASLNTMQRDLKLSQRRLRTLLSRLKATNKTTSKATNKTTKITLCEIGSCVPQATNKTTNKTTSKATNKNAIIPDYISPSFVAPEFAEIWRRFIEYRKEIKKPYKSVASEKVAYNKMVEMSNNDPAVAKDMVERSILGQWQGLYTANNNERRTNYQTNRISPPRTDAQRAADYQELASAVLRRAKARENK